MVLTYGMAICTTTNGTDYPIKEEEALAVMQAVEAVRQNTKFDFHK